MVSEKPMDPSIETEETTEMVVEKTDEGQLIDEEEDFCSSPLVRY